MYDLVGGEDWTILSCIPRNTSSEDLGGRRASRCADSGLRITVDVRPIRFSIKVEVEK